MTKDNSLSEEDRILREKARQALKNNKTPSYSSEDEGGVMAGPISTKEMKKQAEDDE